MRLVLVTLALAVLSMLATACPSDGHCTQTSCPIGTVCDATGICAPFQAPPPGGEGEGEGEGGGGGEGEGEGGGANSVCATSISGNGEDVFIVGTLQEGLAGVAALASVLDPDRYQVGFDGDAFDATITSDNQIVVIIIDNTGKFRALVPHADAHVFDNARDINHRPEPMDCDYPTNANANDAEIDTRACPNGPFGIVFGGTATSTSYAYECTGGSGMIDGATHQPLALSAEPIALATDGTTFLLARGPALETPGGAGPQTVPLPPLVNPHVVVGRAHGAGFLVAAFDDADPAGAQLVSVFDVTTAGVATLRGALQGSDAEDNFVYVALDGSGRLYVVDEAVDDQIKRYSTSAAPELVYTEAHPAPTVDERITPNVLLHGSKIFSGGAFAHF